MLTTAPSASPRSTLLATRQTGGCSPISASAGLECAQSGSRRVRHLPTSLMSPTPSIWASRRCVNTGLTSTGSTTTPSTRTSCFEGAHARQARVCAVRTPSRFKGSLPECEPVCGHSQTATPSRLGVLKQNCLIEDGGGVAGFRSVADRSAVGLSHWLSPAGWLLIDWSAAGCSDRGVARKRCAGSTRIRSARHGSSLVRRENCYDGDHRDRSAQVVACGVRDRYERT